MLPKQRWREWSRRRARLRRITPKWLSDCVELSARHDATRRGQRCAHTDRRPLFL